MVPEGPASLEHPPSQSSVKVAAISPTRLNRKQKETSKHLLHIYKFEVLLYAIYYVIRVGS